MPAPGASLDRLGHRKRQTAGSAAAVIEPARTCCETCSSDAARARSSSPPRPPCASIPTTRAMPVVSVPVLSNITVRARASVSRAPPPLTSTPCRAAAEMPATIATGSRQDQRAGGGHHQDRQRADRIIRQEIGEPGDHEGQGEEGQRPPVGEPHEGRLLLLRRLDQADDVRIGAVGGRGARPVAAAARRH